MNAIGATTAVTTLQPLTAATDKGTQQAATAATLLDQVASQQRGTFTTKELGEMLAALAPGLKDMPIEQAAEGVSGLLGELATRRAAGQDAVLVTFATPGGGVMASVKSPSELARALASDDPKSLGMVITNDGKTIYFRDVMREALGMNGKSEASDAQGGAAKSEDALSPKDQVAAAIVRMLEEALSEEDADAVSSDGDDGGSEDSKAPAAPLSFTGEVDGIKVGIFAFPRQVAAEAGQAGSGLLLDVQA